MQRFGRSASLVLPLQLSNRGRSPPNDRACCPASLLASSARAHLDAHEGAPRTVEEVVPSPLVDGYRNKCEFSFGKDVDGQPALGFQLGQEGCPKAPEFEPRDKDQTPNPFDRRASRDRPATWSRDHTIGSPRGHVIGSPRGHVLASWSWQVRVIGHVIGSPADCPNVSAEMKTAVARVRSQPSPTLRPGAPRKSCPPGP
eukprot:2027448-Prymnesium_polylepis.1